MTTQKEYRANLVKALRSGDYKQGKDRLRNEDNEFCCLGVACDLVNPDAWNKRRREFNHSDEYIYDDKSSTSMPLDVRKLYGFQYGDGNFQWLTVPDDLVIRLKNALPGNFDKVYSSNFCSLVMLNDKGVSFDLIADLIESDSDLFSY